MKQITAEMLAEAGACQVADFRRLFPKGSPKTRKSALKAAQSVAEVFDWDWAARRLLTASAWATYDAAVAPARAAYNAAEASARATYDAAVAPAWAAYDAAEASARAAYKAAVASAQAAYDAAEASARATYDAAKALAFAEAWFSPENQKDL